MPFAEELLPEFDREMATTRRLLERVPDGQGEWKPHPKSFSLGHLSLLVAWMPGWITNAVRESSLDLTKAAPYSIEPTATLLALFDQNVREAREALAGTSDAALAEAWQLTRGEMVFMSMPKREVIRLHLDHLIHHRGQLTVYLRLRDVPLPPIYGPTADERGM